MSYMYYENRSKSSCMHKSSLKDCKLGNMLVIRPPVFRWTCTLDSRSSLWVDPSTGYTAIKRTSIVSQGWQADKNPSECLFSNRLTIELISVPTDNIHSCMSWNIFFRSRYFKFKVVLQNDLFLSRSGVLNS